MKYVFIIGAVILGAIALVGVVSRKTVNPMDEVYVQEIRTHSNGQCVIVARGRTPQGDVAVSCQWSTGTMTGYQVVR